MQGEPIGDYFSAVSRINRARRPLQLGFALPEPQTDGPQFASGGADVPAASHPRDVLRLREPELQALGQSQQQQRAAAAAQRHIRHQPPPHVVLSTEVQAKLAAERAIDSGVAVAATAHRVQLRAGDTVQLDMPKARYCVAVGPDWAALEDDLDVVDLHILEFDGVTRLDGLPAGADVVSARVFVNSIGHAFRRPSEAEIAAATASLAADREQLLKANCRPCNKVQIQPQQCLCQLTPQARCSCPSTRQACG